VGTFRSHPARLSLFEEVLVDLGCDYTLRGSDLGLYKRGCEPLLCAKRLIVINEIDQQHRGFLLHLSRADVLLGVFQIDHHASSLRNHLQECHHA